MTLTDEERRRFRGQCAAILARLERGPATNRELAEISLKYTGRVSDLRAGGVNVECEKFPGGVSVYRIVHREPEQLRLL